MKNNEQQTVTLEYFTKINTRNRDFLVEFITLMEASVPDICPTEYSDDDLWKPIDYKDIKRNVYNWKNINNILLRKSIKGQPDIAITYGIRGKNEFNTILIWVDENYFMNQHQIESFIDFSINLYNLTSPYYGHIHQTQDAIKQSTIVHSKYGSTIVPTNLSKGLPGLYWSNFFGPEIVNDIGSELLSRINCYQYNQMIDGGVLLRSSESPLSPSDPKNLEPLVKLRDQIGEEIFSQSFD